ncbi:hypothetical protein MMC17_002705 [Xylographa soralifera]|nr:hypothetical protein [Xylographa soralifera]
MQLALNILGIPCYHGLLLFSDIRDCEMWNEALDPKFFGKGACYTRADWDRLLGHLIAAYPEAEVVFVERDLEKWFTSLDNAVLVSVFNPTVVFLAIIDTRRMGGAAQHDAGVDKRVILSAEYLKQGG